MDSLGGMAWRLSVPRVVADELQRRFSHKLRSSCEVAAKHIVADVERAWGDYHAGGAAALFDVVRFHGDVGLHLPHDVEQEVLRLCRLALDGKRLPIAKGARSPLALHRQDIVRRLRHAAVAQQLQLAADLAADDDPNSGAVATGADPAAYAKQRRGTRCASSKLTVAAGDAQAWLGEEVNRLGVKLPKLGQSATFEDDYNAVSKALDDAERWPGRFYVPSAATLEWLGWEFVVPFLQDGLLLSDAPSLSVA